MGQTGKRLLDAEGFTKQGNRGDDQAVYIEGSAAVVDVRKATGTDTSDALTVRALAPDNTPTTLFQVLKNGTIKVAGVVATFFSGAFADLTGTLSDVQHGVRTLANAHAHNDLSGLTTGDPHTQYSTQVEFDDHSARHEQGGADVVVPALHAARHDSGGADALAADAAAATPSLRSLGTTAVKAAAGDHTTPAMSATVAGHVPTPPNNTTTFLRGDGTWAAPAGGGDLYNFLTNPGFEAWQRGAGAFTATSAYTADRWQIVLGGTSTISVTKAGVGEADTVADADSKHSLKAVYTHGTAVSTIRQVIAADEDAYQLRGRTISLRLRVRASAASAVRVRIIDSVGAGAYSSYHTGAAAFQSLDASHIIAAGATSVTVEVSFDASVTAYLDNATLVIGSTAQTYYPLHPADEWERCQRYYEVHGFIAGSVTAAGPYILQSPSSAANIGTGVNFMTRKAIAPTMTKAGTWNATNTNQPSATFPNQTGYRFEATAGAAGGVNVYADSADDLVTAEANP